MKKTSLILSIVFSISLSGCNATALINNLPDLKDQIQEGINDSDKKVIFSSAIKKRAITLDTQTNGITEASESAASPSSVPQSGVAEGAPAPKADLALDVSMPAGGAPVSTGLAAPEPARLSIAPFPFWGGSDFNQYVVTFAEENLFPGGKNSSLLEVYQKTIKPILKEWDSDARLLESRGNLFQNTGDESKVEYVFIPGLENEKPVKLKPDWVFRLASTPLKETLTIYVTQKETRVYRMVWGQPQVEIEKVKIDSDQAIKIAKDAFANRNENSEFPTFPDLRRQRVGQEIVFDLPEKLNWRIQLNQQGDKLRYFISFDYRENTSPRNVPMPEPMPLPVVEHGDIEHGEVVSAELIAPSRLLSPIQYLSGSITIDAKSGKVQQLNRPVRYGFVDRPEPLPMPVEPPEEVDPNPKPPELNPPPVPGEPEPLPPEVAPPTDSKPVCPNPQEHNQGTSSDGAVSCAVVSSPVAVEASVVSK